MDQKKLEEFLGPRGEHYHGGHGDAGCFSACPVWEWDKRFQKLQIHIIDEKIRTAQTIDGSMVTSASREIDILQSQKAKLEK